MKFEPISGESYCFVVPSFAQYFNEHVSKIYCHLHVNKAFPQALNSFDLGYMWGFCVRWTNLPRIRNSSLLTA